MSVTKVIAGLLPEGRGFRLGSFTPSVAQKEIPVFNTAKYVKQEAELSDAFRKAQDDIRSHSPKTDNSDPYERLHGALVYSEKQAKLIETLKNQVNDLTQLNRKYKQENGALRAANDILKGKYESAKVYINEMAGQVRAAKDQLKNVFGKIYGKVS